MSSINNMDLKATNSYFDQIAQTSRRIAYTDYSNIDKLNRSLQLTKKYFDQVEQKGQRLSNIYYTNIDSLNEKLQRTEQRLGSIKSLAKNLSSLNINAQLTISSKVTSALDDLMKKIVIAPSNQSSTSSEKSYKEKAIIEANYQKSNDDVYNARMNAKKAGYDIQKAPFDLFNTVFKSVENGAVVYKKIFKKKNDKNSDTAKDAAKGGGCCCCNGGGGSKKKRTPKKRGKGRKNKFINPAPSTKSNAERLQGKDTNTNKTNSTKNKVTKNPKKVNGSLKFASTTGILGLGGSGLGGTPTMGDVASRLTDKIAGSKSGMLKGLGKGLLSGGSKLIAPLGIAASIASVATAKPEERSGAIGSAIGGTAGAAIGGAIGSVIPVFGTTLGMMAGGALGSYVGGKLGESKIAKDTLNTVSQGITGTFDYLADKTKNIKEGFMSFFSGKEKTPETPPAQRAINQVNPVLPNQAASIAATPAVNSVIANNTNLQSVAAQTTNGKTNATGKMQQVQIDAAQMNMISGYLTDFKAQVTNEVSVNVPAGAVQVTVQENEIDYDALVLQIGQRVVNELRKSMQNRKSDSQGNTKAKPIMA